MTHETPTDLRYTAEHEWVRREDDGLRVGITAFAQDQLTDVVYVELPAAGSSYKAGDVFGVVESVKSVSDLYAPVDMTVLETNTALEDTPELVNDDCYGEGWMLVVEPADPDQWDALLDAAAYTKVTEAEA